MSHAHLLAHPPAASISNFQVMLDHALKSYGERRNNGFILHPLATELKECDSPNDIHALLQEQVLVLKKSMRDDERWKRWFRPTMSVLFAFAATVAATLGVVGLVCIWVCAYLRSALSYSFGRYFSYSFGRHFHLRMHFFS